MAQGLLWQEWMRSLLLVLVLAAPVAADPSLDPNATTWLGADVEMLPSGSLDRTAGFGQVAHASAETAYALGAMIEERVTSAVGIAFAPRIIWDIAPAGSDAVTSASSSSAAPTGKQIDLRVRASYGVPLGTRSRFYVYAAPGYAYGFEPSGSSTLNPHGAIAGGGAGIHYAIGPRSVLTIDVGYQWGFQGYSDRNGDIRDRTSYLHLAFGIAGARGGDPVIPPAPMAQN